MVHPKIFSESILTFFLQVSPIFYVRGWYKHFLVNVLVDLRILRNVLWLDYYRFGTGIAHLSLKFVLEDHFDFKHSIPRPYLRTPSLII